MAIKFAEKTSLGCVVVREKALKDSQGKIRKDEKGKTQLEEVWSFQITDIPDFKESDETLLNEQASVMLTWLNREANEGNLGARALRNGLYSSQIPVLLRANALKKMVENKIYKASWDEVLSEMTTKGSSKTVQSLKVILGKVKRGEELTEAEQAIYDTL